MLKIKDKLVAYKSPEFIVKDSNYLAKPIKLRNDT